MPSPNLKPLSRIQQRSGKGEATDEVQSIPQSVPERLDRGLANAQKLSAIVDRRTVEVDEGLDEDEFFTTDEGLMTITNRYDLEKAVSFDKKLHFQEVTRYWVNKPYAFAIIFHSTKENEEKYYLIEPYMTLTENSLVEFLTKKLQTTIKYTEKADIVEADSEVRASVIERETKNLLDRYGLFSKKAESATESRFVERIRSLLGRDSGVDSPTPTITRPLEGASSRPEPTVLEEDTKTLTEYQVEKLFYILRRDFLGFERIDGIKHDINVEDISCDGYNSPVFVYHSEYEQIISNVYHGESELDDFVVKLAQRSGKGISKRQPQVDATLADGSRAQLTLGREVSGHGTNYTIRQFKDVPFTPVDLINWNTFSLDEMAYLWLCIENKRSVLFAGGTASGKTTSLNAVSLFMPSKSKIVSIEDTREVELPQRNWIASVTRPSFTDDALGEVDHFDLLAAALRQRPEYIVMGEVRGEEGRTLFQVMSTGHTSLTTFHADSVGEVIKRFTTDPINVSKTMFTAVDLVSIQTSTRVEGRKVRRNRSITEINRYDSERDEINVRDVFQWDAGTDEFIKMGNSATIERIKFDNGWTNEQLEAKLFERKVVLSYLINHGLKKYSQVAATLQAFINDPETILSLIARDALAQRLVDLQSMESVMINTDDDAEAMVPRPDPDEELKQETTTVLTEAEDLLESYRHVSTAGIVSALITQDIEDAPVVDSDDIDLEDYYGLGADD